MILDVEISEEDYKYLDKYVNFVNNHNGRILQAVKERIVMNEEEKNLTTDQCIKGLHAIKVVLDSAMGEHYPEQTKNQLKCLDYAINELETLLTANTQLKKQIEMLKLDRDCCAFTLEELDLLEQCLSKYVYSITGFPKIAMSCAEKIERLKGDFE